MSDGVGKMVISLPNKTNLHPGVRRRDNLSIPVTTIPACEWGMYVRQRLGLPSRLEIPMLENCIPLPVPVLSRGSLTLSRPTTRPVQTQDPRHRGRQRRSPGPDRSIGTRGLSDTYLPEVSRCVWPGDGDQLPHIRVPTGSRHIPMSTWGGGTGWQMTRRS